MSAETTHGGAEQALARRLAEAIGEEVRRRPEPAVFMHVCGTHEHEIARWGLRSLLPPAVHLLAGPGCPVCVTPPAAALHAAQMSRRAGGVLATYGDMVRVPLGDTSLAVERARGLDLKIVLGPAEAAALAQAAPARPVVFFSPGFETTAAPLAALLASALPDNFFVYAAHRLIPPALAALLSAGRVAAEGLILPGHVLTVTGVSDYGFLAREFGLSAVVTGFEAVDILAAVLWLLRRRGRAPQLANLDPRSVRPEGNTHARRLLSTQFDVVDADWRGVGRLPGSGLALAPGNAAHDAARAFASPPPDLPALHPGCRCGEVLLGAATPQACPLFGRSCTPERPVGPCMVSDEGTCRAAWTWRRLDGAPS